MFHKSTSVQLDMSYQTISMYQKLTLDQNFLTRIGPQIMRKTTTKR